MASKYTFQRAERLKSAVIIARLFKEGESFMAYPLRVVWMPLPHSESALFPAQVAFSVSKRNFRSAVARNRIKRRMREAYRLNKADWYEKIEQDSHAPIALMLIYVGKELLPYSEIEKGTLKMMRTLPRGV